MARRSNRQVARDWLKGHLGVYLEYRRHRYGLPTLYFQDQELGRNEYRELRRRLEKSTGIRLSLPKIQELLREVASVAR